MGEILTKLNQYSKSDIYPFHMPGHKRNFSDSPLQDLHLSERSDEKHGKETELHDGAGSAKRTGKDRDGKAIG